MHVRMCGLARATAKLGTLLLCSMLIDVSPLRAFHGSQGFEQRLAEAREHLEKEHFREAAKAFEAANKLADGKAEEPLVGLATAYYRLGRYQKAIDIAEDLLRRKVENGTLVNAYNLLGVSLYMKDQSDVAGLEKAEGAMRKAIDLLGDGETSLSPRYSLALIVRALHREREAMGILRNLLESASEDNNELLDRTRIAYCHIRASLRQPREGAVAYQEEQHVGPASEKGPDSVDLPDTTEAWKDPREVEGNILEPTKLFAPVARYPEEARHDKVQGVVLAKAVIDSMGCVTNITLLKGVRDDVDQNAVDALSRQVYRPATLEGEPVAVHYFLSVSFRLK